MTLRFLIIFLLVLNMLAYAVVRGWLGEAEPEGESHRIAEQLAPERIRLGAEAPPREDAHAATAIPPDDSPVTDAAATTITAAAPPDPAAATTSPDPAVPTAIPGENDGPPGDDAADDVLAAAPASEAPPADPLTLAPEPAPQEPPSRASAVETEPPAPQDEARAEPQPSPDTPPAATPPAPPAVQATCRAWAGLSADEADRLAQRLRRIGLDASRSRSETPDSWWVRIPPQGSASAAERRVVELNLLGVTDTYIVQDAGPTQYAISLGVFKTESRARVLLGQLRARGVQNAGIEPRMRTSFRIQAIVPDEQLRAVESTVRGLRGKRQACSTP